jgi:hypothetical protein
MKLIKGLLLSSAAGLVAVTSGQAADLPVKAKPVEYVKVCSLYGAGFYYMPGTDICLKVGGYVRAELTSGANGNMEWGPFNGNVNNRTTNNLTARARGYITADARNQTEYGTVRSYIAVGLASNDIGTNASESPAANGEYANRAFVQWAGITAGLSQSFYDFYDPGQVAYRTGYLPGSSTTEMGWWVWGYTAQLGNGFSATVAAEQRRDTQIIDVNALPGPAGTVPLTAGGTIIPGAFAGGGLGAYGGWQAPDIVANLRTDRPWGSAQIMAAAHEDNPGYYSAANALQSAPGVPLSGHAGDRWGWVAGAGLRLNVPQISPGDVFQGQVNVTRGALRYLFQNSSTNWGKVDGSGEAYGVLSDCVYVGVTAIGNNTSCMLTSAWGVNASYDHFWTPALHTSLYGAYYAVTYGSGNGSANANLCSAAGFGNTLAGTLAVGGAGCNNNWSTWGIGSRTQWDVTRTLYVGVEVLYENLHSATTGTGSVVGPAGFASYATGSATVNEANSSAWVVSARIHRDFVP